LTLRIPDDPSLRLVIESIRTGALCEDAIFDRIYPEEIRRLSSVHWTPVRVARRAAELLTGGRSRSRVLDVGSGVGKFCTVAALSTAGRFTGIEQRPHLVELARAICGRYGVPRTEFRHANLVDVDWTEFNGVYLFNPFQENIPNSYVLDSSVELNPALYRRYVDTTLERLARMERGTRIVTYWGFGGRLPETYARVAREYCGRGWLECWVKRG
jgi:predicted RNA methylase